MSNNNIPPGYLDERLTPRQAIREVRLVLGPLGCLAPRTSSFLQALAVRQGTLSRDSLIKATTVVVTADTVLALRN